MRRYLIICAALFGVSYLGHAQVGIGTKKPSSAAMLDIVSEDKGVLIPRVALKSNKTFDPIKGDAKANLGLLVFNTKTAPEGGLTEGFYFWNGTSWERIANTSEILSIIEKNDTQSTEKIVEITTVVDNLTGKEGDKPGASVVLYDKVENKFYTLITNKDGTVEKVDLDLSNAIKGAETKTYFKKGKVEEDGQMPVAQELVSLDATKLKKGQIFYEYFGEEVDKDGKPVPQYINMTSDVLTTIKNNQEIKNEIFNTVNNYTKDGGNVYYGDHDGNDATPYALYTIDNTGKKHLLDLSHTIKEVLTKETSIIEAVRDGLGYNISSDVVSTGNKFFNNTIFTFGAYTGIREFDAETGGVAIPPAYQDKNIEVLDIRLYNEKNQVVKVSITDIVVEKSKIEFSLGSGLFYTPIESGNYRVVVEFIVK